MVAIALLSNPRSTGNLAALPRVRAFVAEHAHIFHYEVQDVAEIPDALATIARVNPAVLVINGGDGTVQAALTELYHGEHFGAQRPPVAVLPNGKTNLIAMDLGARSDPLEALKHILKIVEEDVRPHVVARQLIALSDGERQKPVLGMFLGGAGLADTILYCRHRLYPLGMPNWLAHIMAAISLILGVIVGGRARWLPVRPGQLRVSVKRNGAVEGRFFFLMVTTLEKLLLNYRAANQGGPAGLKMMAIEQSRSTILRSVWAALVGKLGKHRIPGFHMRDGDEIMIEGDRPRVILDGEIYEAPKGQSFVLKPTAPVPFLNLAA